MRQYRVFIAAIVSLAVIGLTVILFLLLRDRHGADPAAPETVSTEVGALREDLAGGKSRPSGPEAAVEAEEAKAEPSPDPGPPLLRGRVTGEGAGVAGAVVRLFATRMVEEALDRMQALIPDGSTGIPDVQEVLAAVREELGKFRASAEKARTDRDGVYEFRRLPTGSYLVLTTADGWLFRYGDVASLAAGRTQVLDLELSRGGTIAGRVVDASGTGVAGVPVIAEFRPGGVSGMGLIVRRLLRYVNGEFLRGPFEAVTAADGSFTLASLPAGIYDLAAESPPGVESRLKGVETGTAEALIYLGRGGALRGLLADAAGVPAAGVTLRIERQDDLIQVPLPFPGVSDIANSVNRLIGEPPRAVRSGSKGEFRLGPLSAGRYRLSIEERGFLPFSRAVDLDWGQAADLGVLRLDRGESIRGVVRASTGQPAAAAQVMATPAQMNPFSMGTVMGDILSGRSTAVVDPSGTFELAGLPRGRYRLTATAPGYAPAAKRDVATGQEPVELVLRPGQRLAGRVVAAADGNPLPAAKVEAGGVRSLSGEDGRFVLDGVVAPDPAVNPFVDMAGPGAGRRGRERQESEVEGEVTVKASAAGYITAEESISLEQGPPEVEIQLLRLPEIGGVVLDPEGNPAPASLVRLVPSMGTDELPPGFDFIDTSLIFLASDVSGLDGKFRFTSFRGTRAGRRYRVIADHVLHARGASEPFAVAGEGVLQGEVEVRLVAAAQVRGMVTDGRNPVPGAAVRLQKARPEEKQNDPMGGMFRSMFGLPKGGDTAHTDREGRFEYRRVAPQRYTLSAEKPGFTESHEAPVDLTAGETREVTLVVDPGGEIAGSVVDPQGDAIAEARVRLFVEREQSEPSKDQLYQAQLFFGGSYKSTRSKEDGSFSIPGLPAGRYTVRAESPGFTPVSETGLEPGAKPVRMVLAPAAALRGLVADAASGRPIVRFRVQMTRPGSEDPMEAMAAGWRGRDYNDLDGRFARDDLDAGTYEVKVAASGYVPVKRDVRLSSGTAVEESFLLPQAGRIRGVIRDRFTNAPVAEARVSLARTREPRRDAGSGDRKGSQGSSRTEGDPDQAGKEDARVMGDHFGEAWSGEESAISGEDGSFLLEGVPLGPQTLLVSHDDYVSESREGLEVALGQEIEVPFTLRPGLSVSGKVLDSNGQAAPGKMVFVRGTGEANLRARKSAISGPGGEFAIRGLEAGPYRVFLPESLRVGSDRKLDAQVRPNAIELDLQADQSGLEIRVASRGED